MRPALFIVLQPEVHIFPGVLTLLTQDVAAAGILDDLQVVLVVSDFLGAKGTHLAAEMHKGSVPIVVGEHAGLEHLCALFVDELSYLHLGAERLCKLHKGPGRELVSHSG